MKLESTEARGNQSASMSPSPPPAENRLSPGPDLLRRVTRFHLGAAGRPTALGQSHATWFGWHFTLPLPKSDTNPKSETLLVSPQSSTIVTGSPMSPSACRRSPVRRSGRRRRNRSKQATTAGSCGERPGRASRRSLSRAPSRPRHSSQTTAVRPLLDRHLDVRVRPQSRCQ